MAITLSPETLKRIEASMEISGMTSPDELVRIALDQLDSQNFELTDQDLLEIEQADKEIEEGKGIEAKEAMAMIRAKLGL